MTRGVKTIFLLTIIFFFSHCQKTERNPFYVKKYLKEIKEARKEAGSYVARNYIPGATFAIAKEGKLIYSEGMGLASKDLETPVDRDTKFRIGDLSETITSLAYQFLVENGTLHPDSTVQHYLPSFPKKKYKLTLENLANHTSGIRKPLNDEENWKGLNVNIEKGLEKFKNDPLTFYPGMYQKNTPFNYNLLGAVLEKATGNFFYKIIKELVTDSLQMENTVVDNPSITIKGRTGYYENNFISQVRNASCKDMRYRAPSQGILSNAEDLVKLGNAMLYSDYISEEVKTKIFTPIFLLTGFPVDISNGWFVSKDNFGRKFYGRKGSVTGGGAAIIIFPDEKLVLAGAINVTGDNEDIPMFQMASHFLSNPEPETE